jgi:hypothetical protein
MRPLLSLVALVLKRMRHGSSSYPVNHAAEKMEVLISVIVRELLEGLPEVFVLEIDGNHVLASASCRFRLQMPEDTCRPWVPLKR